MPIIEHVSSSFTRINDVEFDKLISNSPLGDDLIMDRNDMLTIAVEAFMNRLEIINVSVNDTSTKEKRDEIKRKAEGEAHKLHNFLSGVVDVDKLGMFINDNAELDDMYGHAFWSMKYHDKRRRK